jgi:quercetin dioxygenase-like cupin family protein
MFHQPRRGDIFRSPGRISTANPANHANEKKRFAYFVYFAVILSRFLPADAAPTELELFLHDMLQICRTYGAAIECPAGTTDNSPPFQRRVCVIKTIQVPQGRQKILFQKRHGLSSLRDFTPSTRKPTVETVGYYRSPRRGFARRQNQTSGRHSQPNKIMSVSTKSKGLPGTQVAKTAEFVSYQDGAVVSREIIKKSTGNVTLFAFDEGQGLSEHTAPFDALVQVLEGEAEIMVSGKSHRVLGGEMILLPAGQPHALKAIQRFKMLLTMIRS